MTLLSKEKIENITADHILAIAGTDPEHLFSLCNKDQVKKEYRQLAMVWHSDRNHTPQAQNVMQRLTQLYNAANEKIGKGTWEIPNVFTFQTTDGKKKKYSYLKKVPFELGTMYIAEASVAFAVDKSEKALYDNAKSVISNFKYPDKDMQERLSLVLPQIKHHFDTPDKLVMVVAKQPDEVLLSDLLAHQGGKIDPTHAAWIISRFHNIGCYLEWAGLTHNALSVETCFVSPKEHNVSVLGGWWYAAPDGQKLKALPPKTVAMAPPALFDKPVANKRLDLALIRAAGRELLGDARGLSLIGSKDIPKQMVSWVNGVSSGDAKEDFRIWSQDVLKASFGARRFVEMKINPNDIYKPV